MLWRSARWRSLRLAESTKNELAVDSLGRLMLLY
jgi:hypothetical protein